MNRRTLIVGSAGLFASCAAWSQQNSPASSLPTFRLVSHPTSRWRLTYVQEHEPFTGFAYFSVPPNDPGQKILFSTMYAENGRTRIASTRETDAGPLKKPLFKLALEEKERFRAVIKLEVQFYENALLPGKPAVSPRELAGIERAEYLKDGWPDDRARQWFRDWMRTNNLLRKNGEPDIEFAYNVLVFLQNNFHYQIPDENPEWKEMVRQDPQMGGWRYTLSTCSGECWRLSDTYCQIMRMNAIPARLISGNHIGRSSGHHLRSLLYLDGIGWTPVEATAAVSSQRKPPRSFMGNWSGTMLSGNENIDFLLEGPKGKGRIGTFDRLVFCPTVGKWELPPLNFVSERLDA